MGLRLSVFPWASFRSNRGKKGFLLGIQPGTNGENLSLLFKQELKVALQRTSDIEAQMHAYVDLNEDCKMLHSMRCVAGYLESSNVEERTSQFLWRLTD